MKGFRVQDSGFRVIVLAMAMMLAVIGGCGLKFGLYPEQGNPCAPDAAGIPPASDGDLICKVFSDPRETHLLIKIAEASYFSKNPKHADEALKGLSEVRKVLDGQAMWDSVVGLVDRRFGAVMYAALGDELPQFAVPKLVSPRDKFFLLYAVGKYEAIARAGLAMRAQAQK